MGGDHKCPVCQATFTRPQHVARHMRSHTGDRPYKCQYCGDQFARSDLLSRHVNKCHANEKPLVNTTTRRKGSASTSRATTSKQACDQCVQSSLPCDGSNPCAKCVQRKYRCTYVKFHRQTAPVGPGHNPPRPSAAVPPQPAVQVPSLLGSTSSTGSRYPIYPGEEFVLSGPAAPAASSYGAHPQVSAALHDALYPSQSTTNFPYTSSLYSNGSDVEYGGKYSRGHDDLYRTSPTSSLAPSSASGSAPSSWVNSSSAAAGGWPSSQSHSTSSQDAYSHHHHHGGQLERPVYTQPPHALAPHQQHDLTSTIPLAVRGGAPASSAAAAAAVASGGQPTDGTHFREIFAEDFAPGPRRGSLSMSDGYGHSDTTDGSGSEGGGYYAAAPSNVRGRKGRYMDDTIGGIDAPSPFSFDPHGHARADSTSSSSHQYSDSGSDRPGSTHSLSGLPHPPGTASSTTSSTGGPPGSATAPTFFNAFDSLSLDDPAVLAQIAANGGTAPDGSPFFTHMNLDHHLGSAGSGPGGVSFPGGGDHHTDPDATPMPIKEEASGGLRFVEGSKIQRPLSSLAALQPSSTNGLNWNSYLGLGTPSVNSSSTMNGFPGGWTPGGGNAFGTGTLAGLDMAGLGAFGTGLTPAKDMDSKEMKEFWKQYLKTPLTTSENPMEAGAAAAAAVAAAASGSGAADPGTPLRPRPRVTSMPSSNKTPLARERASYYQQPRQGGGLGPTSSMRTTLQPQPTAGGKVSKEDLASYEAAVLARKTPINLNLGRLSSRRRTTTAGGGGSQGAGQGALPQMGQGQSGLSQASSSGDNMTMMGMQQQQQQLQHQIQQHQQQQQGDVDRANAMRQMMAHHQLVQQQQQQQASGGSDGDMSASASPASRASSLAADSSYPGASSGTQDVDMDAGSRPGSSAGLGLSGTGTGQKLQRPTAKRLASSVLESGTPKAMKFDENPQSPVPGSLAPPPGGVTLPQLHHAVAQQQQQQAQPGTSLPPISTSFQDGSGGGYGGQKAATGTMMAPPPPSSAPPMSGSVLNMNLPRGSLAERRRMAAAAMAGGDARN